MRILHTSDWHLGQTLHQFERGFEHAQFLSWLLDTLEAEQVDALLIAGDVFDNTNPSAASQNQLYRFLTEARTRVPHLNIVMTAGNHDSPGRLEAPAPFLSLFDASVVGYIRRVNDSIDIDRLVVPIKDRTGAVAAWCIAMPFLRPGDVPRVEGSTDPYMAGIEALYRQAFDCAVAKRSAGQAILAMGHCHMTGGQVSEESERRIVIGGIEALSATVFDPQIAYVALGHLHLAQKVGGDATRRYCGSPLPMSFSEMGYPHQVVIIDIDGEQVTATREVRIPRSVDLLRIPEQPLPIQEVVPVLNAMDTPDLPEAQWPYLQVRVLLNQPEPGLRQQVESALEGKRVRLVRIETSTAPGAPGTVAPAISVDELNALEPTDFFERLYQHRFNQAPPGELLAAFSELVNAPEEVSLT